MTLGQLSKQTDMPIGDLIRILGTCEPRDDAPGKPGSLIRRTCNRRENWEIGNLEMALRIVKRERSLIASMLTASANSSKKKV